MIAAIKGCLQKTIAGFREKPAMAAYNRWSVSYDSQPGNLVLDLDEQLLTGLLATVDLYHKKLADIGCGTGRHWPQLYALQPNMIIGFDVSEGMLRQLRQKFPVAVTQLITDNLLTMVPSNFADCVITTLTIAHIKNIDEAIAAWARITRQGGDLIVTDLHPALLAKGGKRTFRHEGKTIAVVNYTHPLEKVKTIFNKYGFRLIRQEEKYLTEALKHYYEKQNALHVYERFKNMPVIYGLHLKKEHAAE